MLTDVTLKISPEKARSAFGSGGNALPGHLGTHFDVMDKEFPLEYTRREGWFFDAGGIEHREITEADVDLDRVKEGMFVGFHTGHIEKYGYGTEEYRRLQPEISPALIGALLESGISVIGVDFPGLRKGAEHTPMDQYCADRGVFVVENLWGLAPLCGKEGLTVRTYPMNFAGLTGLPCRVVVESPDAP
jgi:kynurenine formamidase